MWRIVLVAAILVAGSVMSQEPFEAEVHRRFDAAVMNADPAWRPESSRPRHASGAFSHKSWIRGDVRLSVDHYPHATEHEASETARELVITLPVGFRPIEGYGDEAYLIDGPSTLSIRLILRLGTTVLSIGSRDGNAVLKFGALFLREIERARGEGLVR